MKCTKCNGLGIYKAGIHPVNKRDILVPCEACGGSGNAPLQLNSYIKLSESVLGHKWLEIPTVADLLETLSQFPPEMKVIIVDPDTQWDIECILLKVSGGKLCLTSEYGKFTKEEKDNHEQSSGNPTE